MTRPPAPPDRTITADRPARPSLVLGRLAQRCRDPELVMHLTRYGWREAQELDRTMGRPTEVDAAINRALQVEFGWSRAA